MLVVLNPADPDCHDCGGSGLVAKRGEYAFTAFDSDGNYLGIKKKEYEYKDYCDCTIPVSSIEAKPSVTFRPWS